MHIKTTTHLLITIAVKDDEILQSQKTCGIVDSRPSRNLTRTILPEAFIEHLTQKT